MYYGTVDGFFEYCDARGYAVSEFSPSPSDAIEQGLTRGSQYIDGRFSARYSGIRTNGRDQELGWPREGATDREGNEIENDEIPIEIEHATYEAAFREVDAPGSLLPDYVASEQVSSEKIGSLQVTYATSSIKRSTDTLPVVHIIDMILAPLLGELSSPLSGRVSRA